MSRLMNNNKNGMFVMGMKYVLRGMLTLLLAAQMAFVGAAETITYYHNDALGSPVAATDEAGNLLWREAYRPYGSRLLKEDGGTNDTWYTGKQEDSGTGLSYFGARWYDPNIGRFMAIDPVDFKESNIHSFNRYAYANNNPYKYVDPDGERAVGINIGIGGVFQPWRPPKPGVKGARSIIIAFDTKSFDLSIIKQREEGIGWSTKKPGVGGVFANVVIGTDSTTNKDLLGLGASLSGSTSVRGPVGVGGAFTLPSSATSENEKLFSELGLTYGSQGAEFGVTRTEGELVKNSTIIRDVADKVKRAFNNDDSSK